MKKLLLGIAIASLVTGGAFAKGPVGTVIVPFEFDNAPFYVPCLGDFVDGQGFGEARYHEFETPSGTIHVLDQWSFTIYNVGVSSGTIWVGHAVSPFQWNMKLDKGGVQQWASRARFVPLEGSAPAYIGQDTFKVTFNANGELVVLHEETPDGEDMHCVGPAK
jgi:hypothetical protein